jgi:hypothetical protein
MNPFHCRGKNGLYTVAMRKTTVLILLSAAIACWAIGCVKQPEPAPVAVNQPACAPVVKPEQPAEPAPAEHPYADWLKISPMRLDMRNMWLSAGLINANAGGYRDTDFDALESNATNIANKAGKFAGMWEVIRTANRDMATKAREADWFEARFLSQRIFKSCTDCHSDTWSAYTRGFTPESIDGWLENGNASQNVEYSGLNLTSTKQFLEIMFRMVAYLDRSIAGIDNNNLTEVLKWTKSMDEIVTEQYELWRTVERGAKQIAEIASRTDTLNIDRHYAKMIAACVGCHEKYVPDDRRPKNPLPWKYRER